MTSSVKLFSDYFLNVLWTKVDKREICRELVLRFMIPWEQALSNTCMTVLRFVAASSAVFEVRTAFMAVRILFFSALLRAVRRLVRRTSFIGDLMIGIDPPLKLSKTL